jgi:proline iminopeptidase
VEFVALNTAWRASRPRQTLPGVVIRLKILVNKALNCEGLVMVNGVTDRIFPALPYAVGRLHVSHLHEIYFEQCGNPSGKPALVLHGGPGGGISPTLKQLHDPEKYRVILFDQRGCGQSTPHAELAENTTWDLVADIEKLRDHLGIDRWQVLGGSWGSTLALAYAQSYPRRVTELVLRGIFTCRKNEIDWFYQYGASEIFPEAWEAFIGPIPQAERDNLLAAYHQRLTGADTELQLRCARAWSQWEGSTLSLVPDAARVANMGSAHFAIAFARIECQFFMHGGFFAQDGQLIANASRLKGIPGSIVQGRYDVVTPVRTAFDLHKAWPEANFEIVGEAGHAGSEAGIAAALRRATQKYSSA